MFRSMRFFEEIDLPTVTAQQRRVGKNRASGKSFVYKPSSIVLAEELFYYIFTKHVPAGFAALDGALWLKVCLYYAYPKSMDKKLIGDGNLIRKDTNPDCDNAGKLIQDMLEKSGLISNDSRVQHLEIEKFYFKRHGISVEISELEVMANELIKDIFWIGQ